MNAGLLSWAGNGQDFGTHVDFILGRDLVFPAVWSIPFTAPVNSVVDFDFDLSGASVANPRVGFLVNNRDPAEHSQQVLAANNTTVFTDSSTGSFTFTYIDNGSSSVGTGQLIIRASRITYTAVSTIYVPSIAVRVQGGGLNTAANAGGPLTDIKLALQAAGTIARGSRVSFRRPRVINTNG
jgi:hypothetical protein